MCVTVEAHLYDVLFWLGLNCVVYCLLFGGVEEVYGLDWCVWYRTKMQFVSENTTFFARALLQKETCQIHCKV